MKQGTRVVTEEGKAVVVLSKGGEALVRLEPYERTEEGGKPKLQDHVHPYRVFESSSLASIAVLQ